MLDALLVLSDKSISCNVQNLSCAGAYIKIQKDPASTVPQINIGHSVEVIFHPEEPGVKGKILRLVNEEDAMYFAIYFFQHYYFE